MKKYLRQYKHIWTAFYFPIYLICFFWLEKEVVSDYTLITCSIDYKLPFIEAFIVPYLLWFLFIFVAYFYMFFNDRKEFYQFICLLYSGMTIFIVICAMFPNGQNLRPEINPNENIFTRLVSNIYMADTPTNVFPSIHVYNSLAAVIAFHNNSKIYANKPLLIYIYILGISICLATVFLKQHSIIDGLGAVVFIGIFYYLFYKNKAIVTFFEKKCQPEYQYQ